MENMGLTKGKYINVFKFLYKTCLHKHTVCSQNEPIVSGNMLNKESDICQILCYGFGMCSPLQKDRTKLRKLFGMNSAWR